MPLAPLRPGQRVELQPQQAGERGDQPLSGVVGGIAGQIAHILVHSTVGGGCGAAAGALISRPPHRMSIVCGIKI